MFTHNSQNAQNQFTSGRWTDSEQTLFIHGLMHFGKDWKRFQSIIKTRNSLQIRSHAQKFFLKINQIKKLQKKIKNKQRSYSNFFSQDQTKILQMLKTQKVTNKTPRDILSVLQLDIPRKQFNIQDDEIQNEHSLNLEQQRFRKNSVQPSQSLSSLHSILGIQIGSIQVFSQSISKYEQLQKSNQSYFSLLMCNNIQRMMKAQSILQLVDFPRFQNQQRVNQQEMRDQVNQLSQVMKKSQYQNIKSPSKTCQTKFKLKVEDQLLSQVDVSLLRTHQK